MIRDIALLQLGAGQVGAEVQRQARRLAPRWLAELGLRVRTVALADSTAFITPADGSDARGEQDALVTALDARSADRPFAALPGATLWDDWRRALDAALASVAAPHDLVVLDCASGSRTTSLLLAARAAGAHAVLANKDPLAGPYTDFQALRFSPAGGSLRFSATVGAGLPVVSTLAGLVASGDTLIELSALASGSLGVLCDALSHGARFDAALLGALRQGYTEPDPRQDLSGFDVARKLLILARVAGRSAELRDVRVESLTPPDALDLARDDFLQRLGASPAAEHPAQQHDARPYAAHLAPRVAQARQAGRALRYVARLDPENPDGALTAGLRDLPPDHPLAGGTGPTNVFVLRTRRFDAYPLTITGPGAGVEVTAGAVLADVLRAVGGV